MSTAIRLVRCPKCQKILPELASNPVYECGGCGKILQAKRQNFSTKGNGSSVHKTHPIHNYVATSDLSRLSPEGNQPFTKSSSGSDTKREQLESESHNSENPIDRNFLDEKCHSTSLTYLQDDKLSSETNESEIQGESERLSDQDAGLLKNECLDHRSGKSRDRTSDELSDSCDSCHENEDPSMKTISSGRKHEEGYSPKPTSFKSVNEIEDSHGVFAEEKKFSGEPENLDDPEATRSSESEPKLVVTKEQQNIENEIGKYINDTEDSKGELSRDGDHLSEPESSVVAATRFSVNKSLKLDTDNKLSIEEEEDSQVDVRKYILRENDRMRQQKFADQIVEYSQKIDLTKETSSFSMKDFDKVETSLFAPRSYSVADENSRSNIEKYGKEKREEITAARGPLIISMVFAPLSTDEMYLKESRKVGPSFHERSSEEMLVSFPINPRLPIDSLSPDDIYLGESNEAGPILHLTSCGEMMDTLKINPRNPIRSMSKSPTKTYYAGDESESSYDGPGKLSAQVSRLYDGKLKRTDTSSISRSRQKDGFRVKNKHNGQDSRSRESPEPRKQNRSIRTSWTEANNESLSRGSYMLPRNSQLFHRNESPESSTYDVFPHSGEFRRPDKTLGTGIEKVELLRMVYELEDKINNAHMSTQMSNEQLPFRDVDRDIRYYDDPTTRRNSYAEFEYFGHHRSHPEGVGRANQLRNSRLMSSGEASHCRKHIDCRTSYCYNQDLHFSPKPSSDCIHCQHCPHARYEYENMYPYHSPSPQLHTSPGFSSKIHAGDQQYDHESRMLYFWEKDHVMKRHLRPVFGGSPIINCYHCSELLQLCAGFFLLRRRCHQFRCNSCNKILKFVLMQKSHLVPYVIKIQAHPSNDIDQYNNIVDSGNLSTTSH